jgi:cell wall-associated NlpC family hydrolase
VLSAHRHRVIPATLIATGALAAGVLGTTTPAQASVVHPTSTVASSSVVATTVARTVAAANVAATAVTTSSVAVASLSPAQVAAKRAATARIAAAARVMRIRVSAVTIAKSRVGSRYRAGHAGPRAFDCSGLALYVVHKATGRTLPHYSRAQFGVTKRVAKKNLRPGDLVFFFRHGAHHVGVYIGHGRMVSATNPRAGVKVDSVFSGWYGSRYSGAGRLV